MAFMDRPTVKYTPADWYNALHIESTNSINKQALASTVTQQTRSLSLNADIDTKWDEYRNTDRLGKRVDEIKNWKTLLEEIHEKLNKEIDKCQSAKDVMDTKICRINDKIAELTRCLSMRAPRREINYVSDLAEAELKRYQAVALESQVLLQDKSDVIFDRINRLKEARQHVLVDLQDKTIAMGIDLEQYNLNKDSDLISFKPNCMRIPKESVTPGQWMEYSKSNYDRARREVTRSNQLRAEAYDALCNVENILQTRREAAKFGIRNRIHEMQLAIDELNFQLKNLEESVAMVECDLDKLEKCIVAKDKMSKLAQTRLEARTLRPDFDLVVDDAQIHLLQENCQISQTKNTLVEKQAELRHQLNQMLSQINRVKNDIREKTHSLGLEMECIRILEESVIPAHKVDGNKELLTGCVEDHVTKPKTTGKDFDFIVG